MHEKQLRDTLVRIAWHGVFFLTCDCIIGSTGVVCDGWKYNINHSQFIYELCSSV